MTLRAALQALALAASTLAAQGVEDWVGRGPNEMLADAGWRAALIALMGEAEFQRLSDDMGVEVPVTREGDWIVATGCMPHSCGQVAGFAWHLGRGSLVAVIHDDLGQAIWGEAASLPPSLAAMVTP